MTPLRDSYEIILKTLLAHGIITLPNNSRPYDPAVKPPWWRDDDYCNYHRNKGHTTDNFFKLKDIIQDLIKDGKIGVDGLIKNSDHKAFKEPLPKYNQG